MPYDTPNSRRGGSSTHGDSRRRGGGPVSGGMGRPSGRIDLNGSYHGPRGTQQRPGGRPGMGRRSVQKGLGHGGYPLRSQSINFQGSRGRRAYDRRVFILAGLAVVLVILLVVGISSCVRGCSASASDQATGDQNTIDARVAAGVTDDLTNRFKDQLDRNDRFAQIAAHANEYDDQSLLELALDEPEAVDFVANYPNAQKTGQSYTDAVKKGNAPQLYDWDIRWGAVPYGDHALAISGSGPCAYSMAYMGLTGTGDKTPADMAQLAVDAGAAKGDSGTDAGFFESSADGLGLAVKSHESSSESISQVLDAGTYLLIEAKAGTLTDDAHWVLAVTENSDNSVVVYDPTSPEASAHPWSPATLAASCDKFYSVSVKSASSDQTSSSKQ